MIRPTWVLNTIFRKIPKDNFSKLVPLRSKKAGRFEKLLSFARSHSVLKRSSRAPQHHTLPAFLNLKGSTSVILAILFSDILIQILFQNWRFSPCFSSREDRILFRNNINLLMMYLVCHVYSNWDSGTELFGTRFRPITSSRIFWTYYTPDPQFYILYLIIESHGK